MPNQNVTASKILQHRGTDFPGKRPLRLFAQILSTPGDGSTGQRRLRLGQVREWHANRSSYTTQLSHTRHNILKQLLVRLKPTMHLPVTRYQLLAHRTPRAKRANYSQTPPFRSIRRMLLSFNMHIKKARFLQPRLKIIKVLESDSVSRIGP